MLLAVVRVIGEARHRVPPWNGRLSGALDQATMPRTLAGRSLARTWKLPALRLGQPSGAIVGTQPPLLGLGAQ